MFAVFILSVLSPYMHLFFCCFLFCCLFVLFACFIPEKNFGSAQLFVIGYINKGDLKLRYQVYVNLNRIARLRTE